MNKLLVFVLLLALAISSSGMSVERLREDYLCPSTPIETAPLFSYIQDKDMLFMGEFHGSGDVPKLVEHIVCKLAVNGERTLLALEFPSDLTPTFDYLSAVEGKENNIGRFLSNAFWDRDRQDGRSSQAMLELMMAVKKMRQMGLSVDMIGIDQPLEAKESTDHSMMRDEYMATQLKPHLGGSYDKILVLAGGTHTPKAAFQIGTYTMTPIAVYLENQDVVSVVLAARSGTAWSCHGPRENIICGPRSGGSKSSWGTENDINKFKLVSDDQSSFYDGIIYFGEVTMSPPAIQSNSEKLETQ